MVENLKGRRRVICRWKYNTKRNVTKIGCEYENGLKWPRKVSSDRIL